MIAPPSPSSPTRIAASDSRWATVPTPPEAMTSGAWAPKGSIAASTDVSCSIDGPSRVPSRAISVTTNAEAPTSANRVATSIRFSPEDTSQPCEARSVPRASRPTATG